MSNGPSHRPCRVCLEVFPARKSRCPSCGAWNIAGAAPTAAGSGLKRLADFSAADEPQRFATGPWDVCFGGGVVRKMVNLIAGSPGAGKSTLSLQLCAAIAEAVQQDVLYISTEQSGGEVAAFARRVLTGYPKARERILVLGSETPFSFGAVDLAKPCAVVLDSLSKLTPDPQAQVDACAAFKKIAVRLDIPIVILDHVTKGDDFAGRIDLQHDVDATFTLYPEEMSKPCPASAHSPCATGDDCEGCLRKLYTEKNRNGGDHVSVLLRMTANGLTGPWRLGPRGLECLVEVGV